jgi:alkylation response protein AidB-like acyl-CoA dehydrogenase
VTKISTRSGTAAVTVMVPNSLGPAELLIHYGTEEQKNHYLPRLARGQEIPCFALTNPDAGSDAGAIPDFGIVCKGTHEGKEVLGIRMTWSNHVRRANVIQESLVHTGHLRRGHKMKTQFVIQDAERTFQRKSKDTTQQAKINRTVPLTIAQAQRHFCRCSS